MKFPSIDLLAEKSLATAKRFPLVLLSSFIGTGILIYMIDAKPGDDLEKVLVKIVLTCTLGLTLFLSLAIFTERKKYSAIKIQLSTSQELCCLSPIT